MKPDTRRDKPHKRAAPPINKRNGRLVCICTAKGQFVYLADDYKREFERKDT